MLCVILRQMPLCMDVSKVYRVKLNLTVEEFIVSFSVKTVQSPGAQRDM